MSYPAHRIPIRPETQDQFRRDKSHEKTATQLRTEIAALEARLKILEDAGYVEASVIASQYAAPEMQGYWEDVSSAATWSIFHELGSTNVLVQAWKDNDTLVIPDSITIHDAYNVELKFSVATAGYVSVAATPTSIQHIHYRGGRSGSAWEIIHDLKCKRLLVQAWENNRTFILPDTTTITDKDTVDITFSSAKTGNAAIFALNPLAGVNYYSKSFTSTTDWTCAHHLDTDNLIVQCWKDSTTFILPDSAVITDNNTLTITMGQAISGRAVILPVG